MRIPKGETIVIKFPYSVNAVNMSGYLSNSKQDKFISYEDYTEVEGAGNIKANEVYAQHHHAMFIDKDGQIMGIGIRANGDSDTQVKPTLKIIERPKNYKGKYKKVTTGKFFRLLLTEDNKLFVNGKCK